MNASVQRIPRIEPEGSNFTALGDDSQHSHTEDKAVLFIREDLPADVLFDAAERRQWVVRSMLKALAWNVMSDGVDGEHLAGLAHAAMLLVSDAESLYLA
ncbi:hypothetical protein, partial [Pseudomonas aeruginosa]